MKTKPTFQPVEQLVKRLAHDVESMARKDPPKAMASALGVGLVLNMLPARFIVAGVTAVALTVLRPALFTLGVLKAFELCVSQTKPASRS